MSFINKNLYIKELENYIEYLNNICNNKESNEKIINILLKSIDYCNKLNLYKKRKEILRIINKLEYNLDIGLEIGINKPYLYIDNDTYSNNYYFTGEFKKDIVNLNKKFSYRYQYDKYLINSHNINKDDTDFIIRDYKNILLNTDNEDLKICV